MVVHSSAPPPLLDLAADDPGGATLGLGLAWLVQGDPVRAHALLSAGLEPLDAGEVPPPRAFYVGCLAVAEAALDRPERAAQVYALALHHAEPRADVLAAVECLGVLVDLARQRALGAGPCPPALGRSPLAPPSLEADSLALSQARRVVVAELGRRVVGAPWSSVGPAPVGLVVTVDDEDAAEAYPSALWVAEDCATFRRPGELPVHLHNRAPLMRLLMCLVEARCSWPPRPIPTQTLADLVWPDSDGANRTRAARVHVTTGMLRRMGLGDLLQQAGGAYLLRPHVPLVRIRSFRPRSRIERISDTGHRGTVRDPAPSR